MSMTKCRNNLPLLAALLGCVAAVQAQVPTAPSAPSATAPTALHLGPATCASSVCHGRANQIEGTQVMQNEYRVWTREDAHSRAYNTLLNERSKAIAQRLGLSDAASAKVCLDCHADHVPEAARGEQFQLSDGVGCEACHGGAGEWIKSHAERDVAHADNIAKGLARTEDPAVRAQLCLSCHYGTAEKFAGHELMAAGHPRLSFELATYTANQPAHYQVDADYLQRKGNRANASIWAQGLIASVRAQLTLIQSARFGGNGVFPELAFFDCHACHHPMNELRWSPLPLHQGLAPGAIRLNDGNLALLVALAETLSPVRGAAIERAGNALHRASQQDLAAVRGKAAALQSELDSLQTEVAARTFAEADLRQLRSLLLSRATVGRFADFVAAEQAFLAVETLSLELGDEPKLRKRLNRWFNTVENENHFDRHQFANQAGQLAAALK
ncbi:MAG: hypothetical protein COS34_00425 [Lysobacterales bacterium CG02_land_8_20_14_3_00_62_12]|nr:MAG: hypothetical protein COS34_00425 [Xanthomonadales bacterium CG02_land_8_20_14_3_00_62_12]